MPFIKHDTNPNAPVGGGCLGTGGVRGYDCKPPFYEAAGVICFNGTCPKAVICTHCIGELLRAAANEAIPVGYSQSQAEAAHTALHVSAPADTDVQDVETPARPKAKTTRARKPKDEDLSL